MALLLLIPTAMERDLLQKALRGHVPKNVAVELCGFGVISAAARTSVLLSRLQPKRVVLAGIAGSYSSQHFEVGSASCFASVSCHGIGVGGDDDYQSASQMGWSQWPGETSSSEPIGDALRLESAGKCSPHELLTCTTAASSAKLVAKRRELHPQAIGEDMEGFAVALACRLNHTPCSIVRGASNLAGDRDKQNWRISAALESTAEILAEILDDQASA